MGIRAIEHQVAWAKRVTELPLGVEYSKGDKHGNIYKLTSKSTILFQARGSLQFLRNLNAFVVGVEEMRAAIKANHPHTFGANQ